MSNTTRAVPPALIAKRHRIRHGKALLPVLQRDGHPDMRHGLVNKYSKPTGRPEKDEYNLALELAND